MKTIFLKFTFSLCALILIVPAFAQQTESPFNNKLFATYEDYKNGKPLEGYEVLPDTWAAVNGLESIKVKRNGDSERFGLRKFPAAFVMIENEIMRVEGGRIYTILAEGSWCFYHHWQYKFLTFDLGISEGINGEIDKFKDRKFEELLASKGLMKDYKTPKQARNEWPDKFLYRKIDYLVKYFKLLNEQ